MVTTLFVVAALCIVAVIGLAVLAYKQSAAQPVLERRARVLAKRQDVRGDFGMLAVTTLYFVTFELEGGEREERELAGEAYGQLIEGDLVMLTTKGDTLLAFRRLGQVEQRLRCAI